jgi:hypothetical protein
MLTKLEAINQMLDAIGEDAVSSLEATDIEDVEAALRTFDRVNRQIQAKGWHRNTDIEYELSRDANDRILVPSNALRIDASGPHSHIDVVPRKLNGFLYLYNRDDNVFTFGQDLIVDIVRLLDFESLTPELQMYIAAKASAEFYADSLDSGTASQTLMKREMEAYAALMDAESEADDANILRDCRSVQFISHRVNNYLSGV